MPAVDTGLAAASGRGKPLDGDWNTPASPSASGDDFDRVMQATLAANPQSESTASKAHPLPEPGRSTVPGCDQQTAEPPRKSRNAGAPPENSPSVSHSDATGGKIPSSSAAVYGRPTIAPGQRFHEPASSPKNSRSESLNQNQSGARILPSRGNNFSLSPGERDGVRASFLSPNFALGVQAEGDSVSLLPPFPDAGLAPAAAATAAAQPEPPAGTFAGALPTAPSVTSQNPPRLEPVGAVELPSAKLEPGALANQLAQSDANPGAAAASTVIEKNGEKSAADPRVGVIDPKEKAELPALHSDGGGASTLAPTAESATALSSLPAGPVASPPAADSESRDPGSLETGGVPGPEGQTQTFTVNNGTLAPVSENGGTGVASMSSSMKNPQNTNEVAGLDVKVLPVGANGQAGEKNLPPSPPAIPPRATENRGADWSIATGDGSDHAPAMVQAPFFNVVDLPSLADARLRALDRTHDMMALHAMRLVESKSDALSVVIKPAVGTELSLELRQRAGGVEAQATLLRGDRDFLSQHWPDLQQRLEQRGIKLSPLGGEADFFTNDHGQFRQQQTSQEDAAQQASAFAEFAAAVPAGGATARLAAVHDGWESWA